MVELAVSMTVVLILSAIAIPSLLHSVRTYQLNDAASRLSGMLKFTRYEAVRRNTPVACHIKQQGTGWIIWTGPIANTAASPTDRQLLINGFATLLPEGGSPGPPSQSTITGTLGVSGNLTPLSGANGAVSFDARGALLPLAGYVLYVGSAANPDEFGYRAVVLLPSGSTQVWSATAGGTWQRTG